MKFAGYSLLLVFAVVALVSFKNEIHSNKMLAPDKYKVIKVNGKIMFQQTKSQMKTGDFFVSGTPLSFENQQSRAAIVSKEKGRFVLSPSNGGKVKILPAANNVSSRAGALINLIDIQNHFAGDYLVIGQMELEIGEEVFPQNESNFFYLSYEHNGELIRKKLSSNGNELILSKDEIFKVDGKPIAVEKKLMTLFYREGKNSKKINEFTPVFPDLEVLKGEVEIIIGEYSSKSDTEKISEITAYLNEFYGKPQTDNLNKWLSKEFDLNK